MVVALLAAAACGGGDREETVLVEQAVTKPTESTAAATPERAGTTEASDPAADDQTPIETVVATLPEEGPDEFLARLLGYEFKRQSGRAWDLLHPGQQAMVTRELYTECTGDSLPSGVELVDIETVEVYDDPIDLPGVPQKTSKAVTMKLTYRLADQETTETDTFHAVLVDGRWAWVLGPSHVEAFQAGTCPA